jgi:hypothetical protein
MVTCNESAAAVKGDVLDGSQSDLGKVAAEQSLQ